MSATEFPASDPADEERDAREDEESCDCRMDDCPVCDTACWRCGGEGWGAYGEDWDNPDPLWYVNGEIVRCNCCGGTGRRKDCVYF